MTTGYSGDRLIQESLSDYLAAHTIDHGIDGVMPPFRVVVVDPQIQQLILESAPCQEFYLQNRSRLRSITLGESLTGSQETTTPSKQKQNKQGMHFLI